MRCIYCMWQLVFTDVINKNKLFIIYCNLTCDHLWYRFHDRQILCTCHDGHLIALTTWLYMSLLFIDVMYTISYMLYFYNIIIICSHVICTCTFSLILHTHWEFWLPEFTHSDLCMLTYWSCMLTCWSDIWRGPHALRGAGVLLLDRPFSVYSYFLLFMSFPLISYTGLNAYSIPLFICYHM